jgi:hypothetical protein
MSTLMVAYVREIELDYTLKASQAWEINVPCASRAAVIGSTPFELLPAALATACMGSA